MAKSISFTNAIPPYKMYATAPPRSLFNYFPFSFSGEKCGTKFLAKNEKENYTPSSADILGNKTFENLPQNGNRNYWLKIYKFRKYADPNIG